MFKFYLFKTQNKVHIWLVHEKLIKMDISLVKFGIQKVLILFVGKLGRFQIFWKSKKEFEFWDRLGGRIFSPSSGLALVADQWAQVPRRRQRGARQKGVLYRANERSNLGLAGERCRAQPLGCGAGFDKDRISAKVKCADGLAELLTLESESGHSRKPVEWFLHET